MNIYFLLVAVFALTGLFSTIAVGFSRANQRENPAYEKRTARNLVRLTSFYVVMIALLTGMLLYFMN